MSRPVRTLQLGALALTATAGYFAWHHTWILAGVLGYLAFIALVIAGGADHHDRTIRARHEQARRAAILDDQALAEVPSPCCSFWRHSEGKVHGPDCTRPVLPRRDTSREQAAFEETTAREKELAADIVRAAKKKFEAITADPDDRSVA